MKRVVGCAISLAIFSTLAVCNDCAAQWTRFNQAGLQQIAEWPAVEKLIHRL